MNAKNNHVNYIEFKAKDLEEVKQFYQAAFGWEFTDYGPNYTSFSNSGLEGGFEKTDTDIVNGVLVVLYHNDLIIAKKCVLDAGGTISRELFSFPGGKRFQFKDPAGNELAVWCEVEE